ncbi:NAD(P)-dependent dehydrogenase (short-subunit alcohol dehydrogenase family) [Nonomuraea thailandensis]|uniref:NAD(P)-dependent dehydrogenase (Short-subunit alcohol dehydrogenase family) n=1 Tax=Nonomuraea thailandensis TaxID=1188745 RepID=A0A9X2GIB7_9ACTN|nr:SDR family NAD(P)-dependent oxidoreductase [Nonomuraea thailandensis]MCP2359391.1 NAD(P)-dependent dehydrogenase (short-subunit alcohol dehydrogenase family) [Nonomuraea thailandensis]
MTETSTALVTGANKGIGYAVAAGLAARGMTVLLGSRDRTRGEQAAARLRAELTAARKHPEPPSDAHQHAETPAHSRPHPETPADGRLREESAPDVRAIVLDVTDPATVEAAAASLDRLDVLVNNAGISGPTSQAPGDTPAAIMREVLETNVIGVLMVTDAMLSLLRRSPAPRIVNVSSGVGSLHHHTDPDHYLSALPPMAAYPPSKSALNSLTVQYAKQLRKDGILVNAAAPGACATDFTKDLPYAITRTAAQGAAVIIRLATLGPGGPTGGFFDDAGPVPW